MYHSSVDAPRLHQSGAFLYAPEDLLCGGRFLHVRGAGRLCNDVSPVVGVGLRLKSKVTMRRKTAVGYAIVGPWSPSPNLTPVRFLGDYAGTAVHRVQDHGVFPENLIRLVPVVFRLSAAPSVRVTPAASVT
jgi:hypothetical protein